MSHPPALNVATITRAQREALSWRLRDILHEADRRAAAWERSDSPHLAATARHDYIRGELLGLVAQLEGGGRLVVVPDEGDVA